MSPSHVHENINDAPHRREVNGPRPTPLKINKDSRLLQKQTVSASSLAIAAAAMSKQRVPHRHPVVIYTYSPKIIRTEARDFMALVQKLTGLTRSDETPAQQGPTSADTPPGVVLSDDATSSSVVSVENCSITESPVFDQPPNPLFSDAPLYTPTGSDFFCSPHSLYRCPVPVLFNSPGMGSAFSPSLMEVLKAFQDY